MDNKEKFGEFPTIETERLKLRALTNEDSQEIFLILSSEEVTKYYGMYPINDILKAEELIQKYKDSFESSTAIRWGIELKDCNKIIGTCGFNSWNKRHFRASIGYELNKEFWGKGFGKEAVLAVVSYGFNQMNLERIEAIVYPENKSSENILKKIGFNKEGLLRKYAYFRCKHQDLNMFSLTK